MLAAANGGRSSIVTGSSSSFGQFRLTQFVDHAPPNATTRAQQTPPVISIENEKADRSQMAQSSRPSSGQTIDRTPSTAPSRPLTTDTNQANASPVGFGTLELVELASNPIVEGILGPNKDGRVRNPVPSKLKGKTDNKQGNFGVMHMGMSPGGKKADLPARDAAAERDAAARRTSENTASRAKAAQQEKYMPPKRKGLEGAMGEGHLAGNRGSPFATGREDHKQRARPLAPDETKFEQARLLTLLRSINPVTVVDQICKAVAYFGGIPGAPPPEDGIFPESANTRETGALFIGWLAEIFPDLSSPEVPKIQEPPGGLKKGKGRASKTGSAPTPKDEPPNPRNGFGYGQAVSPHWGLPPSLAAVNPHGPSVTPEAAQSSNSTFTQNKQTEIPSPATPIKQQPEEAHLRDSSASKRGRGRPKGSRNKGGRNDPQSSTEPPISGNNDFGGQNQGLDPAHQSPVVQSTSGNASLADLPAYAQTSGDQQTATAKQQKATRYPEQPWQANTRNVQTEAHSNVAPTPLDELSPEERAVLEAFRHQEAPTINSVTPNPVLVKGAPSSSGVKRKRAPPKPKTVAPPTNASSQQVRSTSNLMGTLPPSNESSMGITNDPLQWSPVDTTIPTAPVAKRQRQRKPKASSTNDPPSRNQTASVVNSATPPVTHSSIPDSTAGSSQQSISASRPAAEGLAAHYESFAASVPQQLPQQKSQQIQQQAPQQISKQLSQQNGRSHTPSSITPSQQLRQQQKSTSSVPPQSQQMQQQKSQQGSQREDQKVSQGASARSNSTGFYNQRSHSGTSYSSQQYPSHQPSQLYGAHQASPQLSNNSINSNSYIAASTHTLAQASPQYSQPENTYKTASPHSISQPSPSFTQPENNFRSTSSRSLAQPSPTYTQAENPYRPASTHSIPPPSIYSSRTHTQTQPAHQGHYSHFTDIPYGDLPTLESLGHSGGSSTTNVNLNTSYGVGLGASRAGSTSNSLYGTSSGLSNVFDTSTSDLLRGVSRSAGNNNAYASSGLNGAFDMGTSEQEMRERLSRNMGGRR